MNVFRDRNEDIHPYTLLVLRFALSIQARL
jgi:hypothetical protein